MGKNSATMTPILSILTPAIPLRMAQLATLSDEIARQIGDMPVEHLALVDNMKRSVGLKRQALLDVAQGEYVIYLDDDDTITENYVGYILAACQRGRDVITFRQRATINGKVGHIDFRLNAPADRPWQEDMTVTRPPWHVCAWRRDLVKDCLFPDINDGEDIIWCQQARALVKTETHIDAELHHYRFDSAHTAATGR